MLKIPWRIFRPINLLSFQMKLIPKSHLCASAKQSNSNSDIQLLRNDFRNPKFRNQLANSLYLTTSLLDKNENEDTIESILDSVHHDQKMGEILNSIQRILCLNIDPHENWRTINHNKFLYGLHNHDNFKTLLRNLEKIVDDLDWKMACSLYCIMGNLHMALRSPLMSKLYIKIINHTDDIDLKEFELFVEGISKSIGYEGSYFRILSIVTSRPFQRLSISRYKNFVDGVKSPEEIIQLISVSKYCIFRPRMQISVSKGNTSNKDIDYTLEKISKMLDQGILNPQNTMTTEDLYVTLDCLAVVLSFYGKHGYKSQFYSLEKKCLQNLSDHIKDLNPTNCALLVNQITKGDFESPQILNDVIQQIKRLVEVAESAEQVRSTATILSKLGVTNDSHKLFEEDHDLEEFSERFIMGRTFSNNLLILNRSQSLDAKEKSNLVADNILNQYQNDVNGLAYFVKHYGRYNQLSKSNEEKISKIFIKNIREKPIISMEVFAIQMSYIMRWDIKNCPQDVFQKFIDIIPRMDIERLNMFEFSKKYLNASETNPYHRGMVFKYKLAMKSKLIDMMVNDVKNMNSDDFYSLFKSIIRWSDRFNDEELYIVNKSGYMDLVAQFSTTSLQYNKLVVNALKGRGRRSVHHFPELIELCIDYILKMEGQVHTSTLINYANAMFHVKPEIGTEKSNNFFSMAADCLVRDFDTMSARKAIELATILARYQYLPPEIVHKIFSDDFIKQSTEYTFYFNTMPMNTFHMKMKVLNQVTCAMHPEYEIPWYYEDYCQEFYTKLEERFPPVSGQFYVNTALLSIVGSDPDCILENVYSSLWNHMNYELAFNKENLMFIPIVDTRKEKTQDLRKSKINESHKNIQHVAIRLHRPKDYSIVKGKRRLNEYEDMNSDMLKCEGFKVVDVDPWEFRQMRLRRKEVEYLARLIFEQ